MEDIVFDDLQMQIETILKKHKLKEDKKLYHNISEAVKKNGIEWQPDFSSYENLCKTPCFKNLFPNMKNKDSLYEKEKRERVTRNPPEKIL